jgi:hypothetical protein
MMKDRMTLLIAMMLIALFAAACGGNAATSPPPKTTVTRAPAPAAPATKVPATAVPLAAELPPTEASSSAQPAPAACEEFFSFCVTASVSGSVIGMGTAGVGSSSNNDCASWAAVGETRILELPMLLGAGESKITVALSRIGAYTGPGTYELKAQASGGMPDMFPTIEVAGRTFSNGTGSTAAVTVAADGSGSLQATGLIEQASLQVSNPDPNARIDFAMQWACQQE